MPKLEDHRPPWPQVLGDKCWARGEGHRLLRRERIRSEEKHGQRPSGGWEPEPGEGGHLSFCGQLLEMEEQSLGKLGMGCAAGPSTCHLSQDQQFDTKASPDPEAQRGKMPHGGLTWLLGAFQPQQHLQGLRGIPGPQGPPDRAVRRSEQPRPPTRPDANPWDPRLCDLTGQV